MLVRVVTSIAEVDDRRPVAYETLPAPPDARPRRTNAIPASTLSLADTHRITTQIHGRTVDVFVFDHHRSAFALWCHAAARLGRPLTLMTLDRHFDLQAPRAAAPDHRSPLEELDRFARHRLAPSNDDHIRAAMEAGAIGDGLFIARSHAPDDFDALQLWTDARGMTHRCLAARTVGERRSACDAFVEASQEIALDLDLDCFTTRSDGHPDEVLAWDRERIDAFLRPPGSDAFWSAVLERTRVITLAREPFHCGGFAQGARLWLDFAEVFFERLLGVPQP